MIAKILIVDDNQANLDTLRYLIEDIEFENDVVVEVLQANNGNDALSIAIKEDLAFIILDIQMPNMDGFEVAKYLQKSSKTKNIPISFLTAAFKSEQMREYGLHLGAFDYFLKPIDPLILVPKIKLYVKFYIVTYELTQMNVNLEKKVKEEVEKNQAMEKKLFQAEKLSSMAELIGNIAHQWRQPLSVISTAATGIKVQKEYGMLTDDLLIQSLDTIDNTSQYLSKLIGNFKNFMELEEGEKIEFKIIDVVNDLLKLESLVIKEQKVKIVLDIPEEIQIYGYSNSLLQCFVNLLDNSIDALQTKNDANSKNKLVFIKATQNDQKVIIEFKDNGGGIQEQHLEKVFEPYFTTKDKSQETGLGLYMTHTIVKNNLGGSIKVQNTTYNYENSEHTGAMFVLQLAKKEN